MLTHAAIRVPRHERVLQYLSCVPSESNVASGIDKVQRGIDNNSDGSVDLEDRQCPGAEQDSEKNRNR